MKRLIIALAAATLTAVGMAPTAAAFSPKPEVASRAIGYLHALQGSDGTVANDATRTEETVWGLAANGSSLAAFSTADRTTIDSLRTHIATEEKTAGSIGSLILAASAAGLSATDFAGRNLLQDLACTYRPVTGAFNDQTYNDALALLSVPSGQAPPKAVEYLRSHQQLDGGWEFSPGSGSDSNTTAVVILALKSAAGLTDTGTAGALAYLKRQQRVDSGGFQYQTGPYTTDSDPNSDGVVIEALLATGQDPTGPGWSLGDKNALTDLLSFQYANGGFGYSRPGTSPTAMPDPLSTTQALVALAGAYLPVKPVRGTFPAGCPTVAPTAIASPSVASTPAATTVRLAQTGGPPGPAMLAMLAGMLTMLLGLRIRRRLR